VVPAFLLLASLVAITPAILVIDETIIDGLIQGLVAIGVALVAIRMPPGESGRLSKVIRPAAIIAVIPPVWMLIQVLPLSAIGLDHPIWTSAAGALGRPISGSISIDTGATLLALARYLCFAGIVLLSAAVSLERQRAGLMLVLLTGVTTLIAAELVASYFGHFGTLLRAFEDAGRHAEAVDDAALGLILAASLGLRAVERYETGRKNPTAARFEFLLTLLPYALAFVTCLDAIFLNREPILLLGAVYGLGTLIGVAAIRRLGLGRWGVLGFFSLALLGMVAVIAATPHEVDPTLALSSGPTASITIVQRILSDVAWPGTGAGTFEFLLPIYRVAEEAGITASPTAAALIAIQIGRPMLLAIMLAGLLGISMLVYGALQRGRDSLYPAVGAACLLALLILSFGNAGVLGSATSLLGGTVFGLGLAQSRSWMTRQ
jgi:hypothetical protein